MFVSLLPNRLIRLSRPLHCSRLSEYRELLGTHPFYRPFKSLLIFHKIVGNFATDRIASIMCTSLLEVYRVVAKQAFIDAECTCRVLACRWHIFMNEGRGLQSVPSCYSRDIPVYICTSNEFDLYLSDTRPSSNASQLTDLFAGVVKLKKILRSNHYPSLDDLGLQLIYDSRKNHTVELFAL